MSNLDRKTFLLSGVAIAAGTVASAMPAVPAPKKYPVIHHALFWLKNPDSAEDRAQLVEGVKTLAKIKTVKDLRVGVVASTEKRDVVDNSWGVSEIMFFENLEGQAAYQTDPIHLEFIKNCEHLWEKVIVYDAVEA